MRATALSLVCFCLSACAGGDPPAPPAPQGPVATSDGWVAPAAQHHGDVRVSVTSVEPGDAGATLAVRLSVENTHPSRRGRYRTWARNASLTDNFGNRYQPAPRTGGATESPLNPAAPVADVLTFEAPIATAGHVVLDLPGDNVGAPTDFRLRIDLQTSGERLALVRQAAAAHEAQAKERTAAAAAKEADARRRADESRRRAEADRAEAERKKAERLAAEERGRAEAEAKRAEAARETERIRAEAEKRRAEAEFAALPGKLEAAKKGLEAAQEKLLAIKRSGGRFVYSGAVPPPDRFDASGKYVHFTNAQKVARTDELNKEADGLKAEIASIEARLKGAKP